MPSSNKTRYLNLNYWAETDRPMRNDFNVDNGIVDQTLGVHINNSDIHVTSEEKAFLKDSHSTMVYAGTGESTRSFTLTEEVRFVFVFAQGKPFTVYDAENVRVKTYAAAGYLSIGSSAGLTLSATGTGFTVSQSDSSDTDAVCLNESGVQYKVVMLK